MLSAILKRELWGHPTGLFILAATELWERMSYYGLRGILVLYLVHEPTAQAMGWGSYSQSMLNNNALNILGWYMMAAYILPIMGGWLADQFLGERKCIFIGGLMMAVGKFIMAIPFIYIEGAERLVLWSGLIILALGNALFKPNISALVGKLYDKNDLRRDSAFTLFYMGINIGALLGFILIGWIAVHYSYHYAFIAAGIGMLIGTVIQGIFGRLTLGDLGNNPQKKISDTLKTSSQLTSLEKRHVIGIVIVSFIAMLFFVVYEQTAGSFLLFTQNNTDLTIGSFSIPPSWILSVNPAFIILFSPFMSYLFTRGFMRNVNITHKYAFGFFMLFVAFIVAAIASLPIENDSEYKVHFLWPCVVFLFITVAELCISPVGLSVVSNLSPLRLAGLMMGVFFFFLGIGNKLSTELGKFIIAGDGYCDGFVMTAFMCLVIALIIFLVRRFIGQFTHMA